MRLPAPLLRRNPNVHKNDFGHVLILAGSRNMLGAAALTGLAALRSGAGLVTIGVPFSLNSILQKKISPVIMTLPLAETREQTISTTAFGQVESTLSRYQAIALGPGLSQNPSTQEFIQQVIEAAKQPLVVDADALTQGTRHQAPGTSKSIMVLTPHPGEMARLIGRSKAWVEAHREKVARNFARQHNVVLLLKGHQTIVASPEGKIYTNTTGNAGMAKAGSGDVLTGMIAALLSQGLNAFDAAKWGAYLHGLAGDLAAQRKTKTSMIATDILDCIPDAIKQTMSKGQKVKRVKSKSEPSPATFLRHETP